MPCRRDVPNKTNENPMNEPQSERHRPGEAVWDERQLQPPMLWKCKDLYFQDQLKANW